MTTTTSTSTSTPPSTTGYPKPFKTQFIFEAQTAIAHHAGTEGNHSVQMTSKMRLRDGSFGKLPCITADTLRNLLRRTSSRYLVEACGLVGQLTVESMRLLFQGGMLTGKGDGSKVKLDVFREMETLVPTLSLFGGCVQGMMIPGRIQVEEAVLICSESLHKVPPWIVEYLRDELKYEIPSYRAQTEELQRVRMDATMQPEIAHLLSDNARKQIAGRVEARGAAHDSGNEIAAVAAKSTMLPRTYDVICAGACFSWEIRGIFHNELEEAAYSSLLALLMTTDIAVGGKKGVGNGKIVLRKGFANSAMLPELKPAPVAMSEITTRNDNLITRYHAHLRDNVDKIREFLLTVDA